MRLADLDKSVREHPQNPFYVSLSDLMMLLCVFFVMILGMSKVDIGSFERVRSGFTGTTKGTLVELADKLSAIAKGQRGVNVRMAEDGVRLDLESAALFATGSSVLKADALAPLSPLLKEILATKYSIDIEGHTDDVPLSKHNGEELETNWSLSGRRASSVVHHLLSIGFKRSRLRIVGYASTRPIVKPWGKKGAELEQARAKNRRVSLLIK